MTRLAFERLGCRIEYDGNDVIVPAGPAAAHQVGRGRRRLEDRGRPLARLPGRPHEHRARDGHAGRGPRPDPREDVREPPVLRRQARLHGRSGDRLRPAPRGRQRPEPASRRAHGEPGHPGRHGDAHRGAVRRGHARRSATSARSTAATSGSTSGCGGSARASSAWPPSACPPRAARRGAPVTPPDPAGHARRAAGRDARAARDHRRACARRFERRRLRRGAHARARVRGGAAPRRRSAPPARATAPSTSRATCWRCART